MSIGGEWILVEAGLCLAGAPSCSPSCFCGLARKYALRFGFLDRPGGHKGHKAPMPLGGGVAIWLATMLILGASGLARLLLGRSVLPRSWRCMSAGALERAAELLEILALATVIMVMGLIDDRKNLKWQLRLGIQVLLRGDPGRLGHPRHPVLAVHPSRRWAARSRCFWIVGLTNSFNMLDNMDGLAASVGLIAACLFCGAQVAAQGACSHRRCC